MTDCPHLFDEPPSPTDTGTLPEQDNGLPPQVGDELRCIKCGERVKVEYNIAFVDGDRV